MKDDLSKMKRSNPDKVIISADKTCNYYRCDLTQYDKLLTENVSKVYRKGNQTELNEVNIKVSKIAKKEKLENRMEIHIR